MAWTPEHKQQSHTRILQSAARLFALHGFDQVSIDNVMAAADMTRGAFYSHFSSKAELYAEAIITAARAGRDHLNQGAGLPELQDVIRSYLSEEHIRGEQVRCPLAFLVTDIVQREDQVRDTYTRVFRGLVALLQQAGDDTTQHGQALQRAVLMVGGVVIARAVNDDDLAAELLDACRQAALARQHH